MAVGIDEGGGAEEAGAGVEVVDVEGLEDEVDFLAMGEVVEVEGEVFAEIEGFVVVEAVFFDDFGAEDFVAGVVEAAVDAEELDDPGAEVGRSRCGSWMSFGWGFWLGRELGDADVGCGVVAQVLEADAAGDEVGFGCFDFGDHASEEVGCEIVVAVDEHDESAASVREAGVAGAGCAAVFLGDDFDARVFQGL